MADAKTIQRLPAGLLDLLGMQSTGDTPHYIAGEVQPVLDLTDLYLTDRLTGANGNTAQVSAVGLLTTTVGPSPGEMWLTYGVTGSSGNLAATTGYTANLGINRPSSGGFTQFITSPRAIANPGLFADGVTYERPMIMRPGDTLAAWISAITGAPGATSGLSLTAFFIRIRV